VVADKLQQRLVKTSGRLIKHTRLLAAAGQESSDAATFGSIVRRIAGLPLPAGWRAVAGK